MDFPAVNNDILDYLNMNEQEKIRCVKTDLRENENEFIFCMDNHLPLLIHKNLNLEFVYVPGGNYFRGFTEENQENAEKIDEYINANYEEMRPVFSVKVPSFLVTRTPILNRFCLDDKEDYYPYFCNYECVADIVDKTKLRIPSETEWEYFARAGSDTLFPFGNQLLPENELSNWMRLDFSDLSKSYFNALGIYGLFTGEWTSDYYRMNYNDGAEILSCRTIRGGGAVFWPWQAQEWVWCMSAMRMPSENLIDNSCSFRLIFDIN